MSLSSTSSVSYRPLRVQKLLSLERLFQQNPHHQGLTLHPLWKVFLLLRDASIPLVVENVADAVAAFAFVIERVAPATMEKTTVIRQLWRRLLRFHSGSWSRLSTRMLWPGCNSFVKTKKIRRCGPSTRSSPRRLSTCMLWHCDISTVNIRNFEGGVHGQGV